MSFNFSRTTGTGSEGGRAILEPAAVLLTGLATTQSEAIEEAGRLMLQAEAIDRSYIDAMHEREELVSTFMGEGVAAPHGTHEAKAAVHRTCMSVVRYNDPIDWDGHEVRWVVGIAGVGDEHLALLQKVSAAFASPEVRERLDRATSAAEAVEIFTA